MAQPIVPNPSDYVTRVRDWGRAAVEWLGLNPAEVMNVDLNEEPHALAFSAVRWEALTRAEPTRGTFDRFDIRWTYADPEIYIGFAHFDYEEGLDLYAEIGPKPEFMSAAEEARLRSALGDRR